MESDRGSAPGASGGSPAPAPIRRPLLATVWIAAVLAAAVWPVVSHFLLRRPLG